MHPLDISVSPTATIHCLKRPPPPPAFLPSGLNSPAPVVAPPVNNHNLSAEATEAFAMAQAQHHRLESLQLAQTQVGTGPLASSFQCVLSTDNCLSSITAEIRVVFCSSCALTSSLQVELRLLHLKQMQLLQQHTQEAEQFGGATPGVKPEPVGDMALAAAAQAAAKQASAAAQQGRTSQQQQQPQTQNWAALNAA